MKKTLVLVVDRDDDFGEKANIVSPVIGEEGCIEAATALGIADPEDSDTNALFGALRLYREMVQDQDKKDDEEMEVALICGNKVVGRKSDEEISRQLEEVINKVKPTQVYFVSDGAEDDYVQPLIKSRNIPITHVEKIYVKQAPTVEGAFYTLKGIIEDTQKRKRFLAPLSWIIMILSAVYIISSGISSGSIINFIGRTTTPVLFFAIGILVAIYAYNLGDSITAFLESWAVKAKQGSMMFIFFIAALSMVVLGLVVSAFSVNDIYTENDTYAILAFISYFWWFLLFALMTYSFGAILDGYLKNHIVKYRYIGFILNIVALGLIVTGVLDYMMSASGLYGTAQVMYIFEVILGFALTVTASVLNIRIRKMYAVTQLESEGVADEVQ